jgi:hypothetical protein
MNARMGAWPHRSLSGCNTALHITTRRTKCLHSGSEAAGGCIPRRQSLNDACQVTSECQIETLLAGWAQLPPCTPETMSTCPQTACVEDEHAAWQISTPSWRQGQVVDECMDTVICPGTKSPGGETLSTVLPYACNHGVYGHLLAAHRQVSFLSALASPYAC